MTQTPYKIAVRTEGDSVNLYFRTEDETISLPVGSIATVCLEDVEVEKALHKFCEVLAKSLVQRVTEQKVIDVIYKEPTK